MSGKKIDRSWGKVAVRILLKMLVAIVGVLLIVTLLLNVPAIQTYLTSHISNYLEKKLETVVRVEGVKIALPKTVVLKGIYIEDQNRDTLLYLGALRVNVSLFRLLKQEIEVTDLGIQNLVSHVHRKAPENRFNFQFIIDAFAPVDTIQADEEEPGTASKPWVISATRVSLGQINASYYDDVVGIDAHLDLGELDIKVKTLDIDRLAFEAKKITVRNALGGVVMWDVNKIKKESMETIAPDTTSYNLPIVGLDHLLLDNISLSYKHTDMKQHFEADIGKLELGSDKVDLNTQEINLNSFSMENSAFLASMSLNTGNTVQPQPAVYNEFIDPAQVAEIPNPFPDWNINLDALDLKHINLKFDDISAAVPGEGIDFAHIQVDDLNLGVSNAKITPESIAVNIRNLSLTEKSGFKLTKLACEISADGQSANIKNLNLVTPNSSIKADVAIKMASIKSLTQDMGSTEISLELEGSMAGFKDILFFSPGLSEITFVKNKQLLNPAFKFNAGGTVDNIHLELANVQISENTQLKVSGIVTGLPEVNNLNFLLNIDTLYSTKNDLYTFLDSSMFGSINIPQVVGLSAVGEGSPDSLSANISVNSSFGSFIADIYFDDPGSVLRDTFNLDLSVIDFKLDEFVADTTLKPINLNLEITGTGAFSDSASANLKASIQSPEFNGYKYQDIFLTASMHKMIFDGRMGSADPNANFNLDFNANLSPERQHFGIDLDLSLINFHALNFIAEKVALETRIKATANYHNADDLDAEIKFSHINIYQNNALLPFNTASIITRLTPDSSYLSINSTPLNATVKSNISSVELEPIFRSAAKKYLGLTDTIGLPSGKTLEFDVKFNRDETVKLPLLPEIKKLVVDNFSGRYNSNNNMLTAKIDVPKMIYGNIKMDSIMVSLNGHEETITLQAGVKKVATDSLHIDPFLAKATIDNGEISSEIRIGESQTHPGFFLASNLEIDNEGYAFSILHEGLIMNGQKWYVPQGNSLLVSQESVGSKNFSFKFNDQQISITINDGQAEMLFDNFDINNLISFISYGKQNKLLQGGLDGKLSLPGTGKNHLKADLQFDKLYVLDTLLGKVKFIADYRDDLLKIDMGINNKFNTVSLNGSIDNKAEIIDLKAVIGFSDLNKLEKFTLGELSQLKGAIDGELTMNGSFDDPGLKGIIRFKDTRLNIVKLNFLATLKNESLRFDDKGIHFDKFTITDAHQKELEVNGSLLTGNYRDFAFDLNISADKFQPVNSTSEDNQNFYGKLIMDTDLKIRGDLDLPLIEASLKIDKGTDLTYVLPGSEIELVTSEGTVNFIDPDIRLDTLFAAGTGDYLTDSIISRFQGLELSANLQLDPEAKFTLVIDPASGDYITVNGKANLNITVDESGSQTLTGIFEVKDGYYQISFYGLVKKSFTINPESTIAWSGRPMDANLIITAKHIVRTSSTALIANDATSMSESEMNMFKERLPYEVLLNISGFISEPVVSFNIALPEKYLIKYPMVASKLIRLNTPEMKSELNKQVFALLVAGSFIADNPLASGGNTPNSIATTAARNSVNGILAEQLNNISSQYIKNVDLNFGLTTYEDYSSGSGDTRTELDVQVSKKLFNDRLTVEAMGSFDLEGDSKKYTGQTSQHMYGEFSVTYDLNETREHKIRLFRENAYDIFDGEITYSGVALIFEKSFNQFRKKDKKKKPKDEKKVNSEGVKEEE